MDSVTQFVLGAAVGQAVLGRRVGARAALVGGIVATLPDLDVFVPLGSAVADFTYHRSFSHSLLVLSALAPGLAWLVNRMMAPARRDYRRWLWLCWLCLVTHVLLDSCTIYGTQLLWPLTEHPFGLGQVFIIDPVYTLTLLAGLLGALALARRPVLAGRVNAAGLSLSTAYLAVALVAQGHVLGVAREEARLAGLDDARVLSIPTPFNIVLWRSLVMTDDGYHVAYYSLAAPRRPLRFERFEHRPELLDAFADSWVVQRLRWFTRGFLGVRRVGNRIVVSDLRMGLEPDGYVFSFAIAEAGADGVWRALSKAPQLASRRPDDALLGALLTALRTGVMPRAVGSGAPHSP